MTRLLAHPDAPDLLKHRGSIVGGVGERWSGVERNVPTDRLLQGGWKLHMAAPYSKATTSRDLDPGKGEWLCIAARKAGTDVLIVAAMAKREDVLRTTSSSTEAIESNGVFWYHWPAKACGFSGHEKLNVKPEPKAGMTVTTTSDRRGAPSGKPALHFSKGSRKTIVELKEENGEFYATETEYGGSLWFPLSSTDFYSVVGQIGYGDQEHTNGEYRLSWCLDGNGGGYRAGKIKDLEKSGKYEKVVFYSKFDEIEGTALHGAAGCSKSGGEAVSLLLDIGGRELLDAPDSAGRTAREIAAASKHSVVVAEIDRWTQQRDAWEQAMQHRDARNASFIAAGRDGQLSSLKTLLAMNADVYAKDSEGSTALHRAAEGGHGDVAALLLQEGGQRLAAMPNGRGQTARELAVLQQRELDVTKTGVQGSSVNVVSILDSTMRALDSAALQAHTELQARNSQERAYLSAYVAQQEALRASAAALLQQGKPLREQHTKLLEEYQRDLREVTERHTTALEQLESPLLLTNRELNDALSKIYALRAKETARLDALRTRVQELLAGYTAAHSPATQPLTPDEYAQLLHSILFSKSRMPGDSAAAAAAAEDAGLKFVSDVKRLVIGEFEHAADGLPAVLGMEEDELNALTMQGLPAMAAEVEAIGDPVLTMWWDYVVNQAASEKQFSSGIRDQGRAGVRLEGFAELDEAKIAGLKIPELAAIRLYSTPAFPFVNDDLRAVKDAPPGEKRKKHPLAVLIALLVRGIKKLRKVDASADEATKRKILWRGMKNVEVTSEFEQKGGTELGAMSTTTDLDVAFNYCRSSRSLIFKIVTENKLQRGASVQWISAFPNESEVLFSPLTFMQPTGKTQVVEMDGYHITIVEVRVTTA